MPTQYVEVALEVPDEELTVVALRRPQKHELYLDFKQVIRVATGDETQPVFVLSDHWQWPEWLTAKYVAMDSDGTWWAFDDEPVVSHRTDYWITQPPNESTPLRATTFCPPRASLYQEWYETLRVRP